MAWCSNSLSLSITFLVTDRPDSLSTWDTASEHYPSAWASYPECYVSGKLPLCEYDPRGSDVSFLAPLSRKNILQSTYMFKRQHLKPPISTFLQHM